MWLIINYDLTLSHNTSVADRETDRRTYRRRRTDRRKPYHKLDRYLYRVYT